jgi:hypothetical protein
MVFGTMIQSVDIVCTTQVHKDPATSRVIWQVIDPEMNFCYNRYMLRNRQQDLKSVVIVQHSAVDNKWVFCYNIYMLRNRQLFFKNIDRIYVTEKWPLYENTPDQTRVHPWGQAIDPISCVFLYRVFGCSKKPGHAEKQKGPAENIKWGRPPQPLYFIVKCYQGIVRGRSHYSGQSCRRLILK